MKKIPSLFKRNYDGDRLIYNEVVPDSQWVINGEGQATVKIDGTACMVRDGQLYKRYDAKKGKQPPAGWEPCEEAPNEHTGHWPGWLLVDCTKPEDHWHCEAYTAGLPDGTYELIGPKVQGNPYGLRAHELVRHGIVVVHPPRDFEGLRVWLEGHDIEGIVWHHPDGRMAKIKRVDFGLKWPIA